MAKHLTTVFSTHTAVEKDVTDHFLSEQLLPFDFARQCGRHEDFYEQNKNTDEEI